MTVAGVDKSLTEEAEDGGPGTTRPVLSRETECTSLCHSPSMPGRCTTFGGGGDCGKVILVGWWRMSRWATGMVVRYTTRRNPMIMINAMGIDDHERDDGGDGRFWTEIVVACSSSSTMPSHSKGATFACCSCWYPSPVSFVSSSSDDFSNRW